jgi:Amt family ammonium transporter
MKLSKTILVLAGMLLFGGGLAFAQDAPAAAAAVTEAVTDAATAVGDAAEDAATAVEASTEPVEAAAEEEISVGTFVANNVWMMLCAALVFIMHLGFASLESGLTRAKNTVNILFKNVSMVSIGILTYAIVGFNLMYPGDDFAGKLFGFAGFGLEAVGNADNTIAYASGGYTYWTDFLFQAMFAATAATIISGAVAERIKLSSFLIFNTIYVSLCYPIVGMWQWGGGYLAEKGFHDFAGSTIVHSVGGWGALVCAFMLGPRIGKYINGQSRPIMGHNLPLATIGMFLLWLGWFGFNGGSVLSADPATTSLVLVTTCLAAAAGVVVAMFTSWIVQKTPDLTMILNGALAGLVGITAGADVTTPFEAIIIGGIAGLIVVFSVLFFDRIAKIDDPVGAISVHLVCGIWGTLAVGLFATEHDKTLGAQITGVVMTGVFCVVFAGVVFGIIKAVLGVRVSEEEELRGLDLGEHSMEAYGGFQIFSTE